MPWTSGYCSWSDTGKACIFYEHDLHAADAVYHRTCRVNFCTKKQIPIAQLTTTEDIKRPKQAWTASRWWVDSRILGGCKIPWRKGWWANHNQLSHWPHGTQTSRNYAWSIWLHPHEDEAARTLWRENSPDWDQWQAKRGHIQDNSQGDPSGIPQQAAAAGIKH